LFGIEGPPPPGGDHVGDERFGYWEDIPGLLLPAHRPPAGHTYDDITGYGLIVDPDTDFYDRLDAAAPGEFRPSTQDNPGVNAPSTGRFIPGKNLVDTNGATEKLKVEVFHQIRVKGTQPTDVTRVQFDPGEYGWKPQRWVSNVLELTETKQFDGKYGGLIEAAKGIAELERVATGGSYGGTGGIGDVFGSAPGRGDFDFVSKHPISVGDVARLSTENWGVKYYVPDSCGGTTMIENGVIASSVPAGRSEPELDFRGAVINDPLPAPPLMTPPQK
jgi:hypothetical protein